MDGVVVSNHGGRQVAGSVAAADALPRVVEAAGDRLTCCSTAGSAPATTCSRRSRSVRGRCSWDGRTLLAEFDLTLALSGHSSPATLGPADLIEETA